MTVQSRWTLPLIVDPPDRLCVLVEVPNERYHIAAFLGALYQLTRPYSWAKDPAHTAVPVGAVWQPIFDSLRLRMCADFDCPIPIDEYEVEMSLCDNLRFMNGKLQVLCCGQWVNVDGQASQGIGGPGQPGGGSGIPAPGQCQTYHAVLNGKDQWQAPPPVNAGDTVQISNLSGAWSDGAGLFYCPVGSVFFAGNCTITTLDALDPLPSQGHMALLSKIAGVFTNVSAGGVITVPGGVVNALLLFQANDHALSDNGGEITFDVTVCNRLQETWSSVLDFTTNPYGFFEDHPPTGAVWVAGVGWQATNNAAGSIFNTDLEIVLTSTTINHVELTTITSAFVSPASNLLRIGGGGTVAINPAVIAGTGTNITLYDDITGVVSTDLNIALGGGGGSGLVTYTKLLVRGTGTKPPELP